MRPLCRGLLFLLFCATAWAAEVTPSALSHACNSCHGPGGYSPGAIPSIAGMPASEFTRAMRTFKSGERPGTIMGRIAPAYSDEEIAAMAEYYEAMEEDGP